MTQQVVSPEEIPRGETETVLGGLLAEVIGIPHLPRTTSFFDLGLDSLSVAVACARLEQATGVRVSFSQLFRTPNVAELAAWVDAARDQLGGGPGIPAKPSAGKGAELVAITPRQAHTVPMGLVVNAAWWFDGEIDDAALESAANDVHRRHQALRARYFAGPDLGLAEVPADPGQAEFHRLPPEDSDKAALDALLRTLRQPLRLDEGEVWRCAVVRSGPDGRTLFGVAADHAGFDGRSLTILTTELSTAYAAHLAGKEPQWAGRVATLAEMAADYRHQVAAQDPDAQRRYWREELRDLPACRLPGRNDGPAQSVGPAKECAFTVPTAQLRVWEDYARVNGMSASVGIAASYVQSVIRAGAEPDFGLGVALANWSGEIIDRTITNRVGNIFLRPNGPSNPGPHLLARMRESYNRAMAARDVLVDPTEYVGIAGDKNVLDGIVGMVYNSYPPLDLGGVVGKYARELRVWTGNLRDIFVEVETGPEGLGMHMIARTDRYEPGLADRLGEHFMDIINNGPERLERETAR